MTKFRLTFLFAMMISVAFAQDHIVISASNTFTPMNLTITQGETVEWQNTTGTHNVNGDQMTYPSNPEGFNSGAPAAGNWVFQHTFNVPGTYEYQCDPHVGIGMVGTITVEAGVVTGDLVISGIYDAQPAGAGAKGFELYAINDIADLSAFGVGSANNGGGSDGEELSFTSISVAAGECIYVANDSTDFNDFFGFFPHFTGGAANINGDDAIELFEFGTVIDVFGDINMDGSGEPWEYLDGWAYRNSGVLANMGTFTVGDWMYSGTNVLDGEATNAGAAVPFPSCTYSSVPPMFITTNDDAAMTDQDVPIGINVLVNDVLPNGVTTLSVINNPPNGTTTVNPDNTITYTPNAGFCGMDQFTYEVCDNTMNCETAVVNVTIECQTTYTVTSMADAGVIDADGVLTTLGDAVELTGVVYGVDLQGDNPVQFTFIDGTGGLGVFSNNSYGYTVNEGDEVTIQGVMSQFNGLAQVNPDTIIFNSANNPLNTPMQVSQLDESTESELVEISSPVTIDPADWVGDGSSFNVTTLSGITIRIDNDTDLANMATLQSYTFIVRGLGGQFDNSVPHTEGYQLLPRYSADIIFGDNVKDPAWAADITLFPNPVNEMLNIQSDVVFDQLTITNVIGEDMILSKNANQISVADLPAGTYIVKFTVGDEVASKFFVKM